MGTSSISKIKNNSLLSIKLLSLTKIDDFRQYFIDYIKIDKDEDKIKYKILSIFNKLIIDNKCNENSIKLINEFFGNKILKDNEDIYKYILEKLDNELDKFIKNNKENKNNSISSIIKDLFKGKKKFIKICSSCKQKTEDFDNTYIILSTDLSSQNENYEISTLIINMEMNYEKIIKCDKCNNEVEHNIKVNFTLPKIIITVLNNFNDNNKINFKLSENIENYEYNLICYILSTGEMIYKNYSNWYEYNAKNQEILKIEMNENRIKKDNPIIFFYQKKDSIKEKKNEDEDEEELFFKNKNYTEAIINYIELHKIKVNPEFNGGIYLIYKSFFDELSKIINIDINNLKLDENDINNINKEIEKNKIEIMKMNKLLLIDNVSIIEGDIDFINEIILDNLGFFKPELKEKEILMCKISDNIFQFIFKDNSRMNLTIKNGKQEISFLPGY